MRINCQKKPFCQSHKPFLNQQIIKTYWSSSFWPKVFFVCFVRRIRKLVVKIRQTGKKIQKKKKIEKKK